MEYFIGVSCFTTMSEIDSAAHTVKSLFAIVVFVDVSDKVFNPACIQFIVAVIWYHCSITTELKLVRMA